MRQIFVSHTKKDVDFCDKFDVVCARIGIRAFRSEFEDITPPPYKTIRNAMANSVALFLLVGKELVKNQSVGGLEWAYTQNWIAYEIGLACQRGIDVWAICDDVEINFPMPYITNLFTVSIKQKGAFDYIKDVLSEYVQGRNFAFPSKSLRGGKAAISCPYEDCRIGFNYHVHWKKGDETRCPHCLKKMRFTSDKKYVQSSG